MKVLAVIPARGGSKRVPGKNIRELGGKPLISYTIKQALSNEYIGRVIVSTDNLKIAEIAKSFGAEIPFIRPAEISADSTIDRPVFQHAVNFLRIEEGYLPDVVLNLRPTSPFRSQEDISAVIEAFLRNGEVESVRTVTRVESVHHPYWMMEREESGLSRPLFHDRNHITYPLSQQLPPVYRLNGAVDGMRTEVLMNHNTSMYGDRIYLVEIPEIRSIDIDTMEDFELAEHKIYKYGSY